MFSLLTTIRAKYRKVISVLLLLPILVLFLFSAHIAPSYAAPLATATPSDNDYLKVQLNTLTGSSLGFLAVGLVPFYNISIPAEIAIYGLDLGVRFTPAEFSPPEDKQVYPNAVPVLSGDGGYCKYDLGIEANKQADQTDYYFLDTDALWTDPSAPSVFGNLGEPEVYHPHARIRVSADNPEMLTEGEHRINWQATTRVNRLTEIEIPLLMLAKAMLSEKNTQKKAVSKQIDTILKQLKKKGKDATPFAIKKAEKLARTKILAGKVVIKLLKLAAKLGVDGLSNKLHDFGLDLDDSVWDEWIGDGNTVKLEEYLVNLDQFNEDYSFDSAVNKAIQDITVWDQHPPYYQDAASSSTVEEQHISLEATDFGGVRLGRVSGALQNEFVVVDDCNRPTTVSLLDDTATLLKIGETTAVRWQAYDQGPYPSGLSLASNQSRNGEDVFTRLVQYVTVADTQPPLLLPPDGFARESATAIDLTTEDFPLGRPKIVDLADPRPTFSHNAPDSLEVDRRYAIVWESQDASGNVTVAGQDNPDQYTQYVTIKTPGSNTVPQASDNSATTLTAQAVEIELSGIDNDFLDGRADPLAFKIEEYPQNGQFEAPLLPFFIEDFRLSPVGDNETIEDNEIVRTSPLGDLADQFRLADEDGRSTLLDENYCQLAQTIPQNFVYNPTYVHVDDDDYYYVRDSFWSCNNNAARPLDRVSKWNRDGELIAMRDISSLTGSTTAVDNEFSVDGLGWLWFSTLTLNTDSGNGTNVTRSRIYGMNSDLDFFQNYGEITTDSKQLGEHDKLQDMAVNITDQIFYELRGFGFRVKQLDDTYQTNREIEVSASYANSAFRSTTFEDRYALNTTNIVEQPVNENIPMAQRDGFTSVPGQCLKTTGDGPIYTYNVLQDSIVNPDIKKGTYYRFQLREVCPLATDIEVDSDGFVYIAQRDLNRILKYAPAYQSENGNWQTGELIGWMGDCVANRQNNEGVYYNACDEQLGISRGFTCTDDKCEQANSTSNVEYSDIRFTSFTGGVQPGAFNSPASIKMGPGDILYVADTGNSRVQRFGSEGAFAGEARSTGTGINQGDNGGFMLGNFGMPYSLSVNSSSFYVINRDDDNGDNFLHVFRTLPFYDVTDNSAKIKYVSDFNFQGSDSFDYIVDDGIAVSTPATVSVAVTRAFRPPEQLKAQCYNSFSTIDTLDNEIPCRLDEDEAIYVHLTSADPDGFVSTGDGGLDQHSFSITLEPQHGQLSLQQTSDNGAVYRYTPAADFNGADSFAFNAFDGVDSAAQDGLAELTVEPVPDPVDIDLSGLKAARGFTRMISVEFSDVDENYQPELSSIKWGDGTQTIPQDWVNSGRVDENGVEMTPQIDFTPPSSNVSATGGRPGTGLGMLTGGHLYQDTGNHTLEVRMMNHDNDGEPNLVTLKTANIEVIEATVVTAVMNKPATAVNPDTAFDIEFTITNEVPQSWAGLIARNTAVAIEIPVGMTVLAMDSSCSGSRVIDCDLGSMAVGESRQISLSARVDLAAALVDTQFELDITLVDDGPHIQDTNLSSANISMADQDEDTVVDVADAFPTDARYAEDADSDGMADEWERLYGLNDSDAADATLDPDGDGVNNLVEFIAETYPLLAEATSPPDQFSITAGGDDRLGFRVAAGDINDDGFSDVVAGAPGYQNQGAIVVYYGSADGAKAIAPITVAGSTGLGQALAVGDLNDDQYDDIAVSSDQGVYLFMGSETSFETPVLIQQQIFAVDQPVSDKFGVSLLIADLDNDGLKDLIVGDTGVRGGFEYGRITGGIHVYRASDAYWLETSPARGKFLSMGISTTGGTLIDQYRVGDSLAVGDIDGDNIADLMVGAAFADPLSNSATYSPGVVSGFLGNNIDWSVATRNVQDFILYGETAGDRFGYSIASGEDIDGDGKDDLLVGAYRNNGIGAVYLFNSTELFWEASAQPVPAKIQGASAADQFGVSLALTPVTAYSGEPAIIVGSNRAERDTDPDEGRVDFYSASATTEPWLSLFGNAHDMLGYSVANAGDINNDGEPDYVTGAPDISINSHLGDGSYIRIYSARSGAAQQDKDEDSVADQLDNCINTGNTDQTDEDSDGVGDVCDSSDDSGGTDGETDGGDSGSGGVFQPTAVILLSLLLLLFGSRSRSGRTFC